MASHRVLCDEDVTADVLSSPTQVSGMDRGASRASNKIQIQIQSQKTVYISVLW